MVEQHPVAQLTWAGERHLRIYLGEPESHDAPAPLLQALAALKRARLPGLIEVAPAYSTILLAFAPGPFDERQAIDAVRRALASAREITEPSPAPIIEIPVCYEPPCTPDAEDVARYHDIDVATLIRLHTRPLYTVRFIGFVPGFGYLSGLPTELVTPRLDAPRVRVPPGSVGIAGDQTGVYPSTTPGGWRLIGRTPLVMFDARRERPSLLAAGDRVRFIPIDLAEFEALVARRPRP